MVGLRQRKESKKTKETEKCVKMNKKALAMRRYRMKLKTKRTDQYAEMKEKDKLRKQAERTRDRSIGMKNKQKIETGREKWREQKRKYRKKVKDQENENTEIQGLSRNTHIKTGATPAKEKVKAHRQTQHHKLLLQNKKKGDAVTRTTLWRMKIKLRGLTETDNTMTSETHESASQAPQQDAFPNRMSEHRAYKKVRNSLPQTPRRKASILQKLIESPRTNEHLKHKGVVMSKEARKRLNMGEAMLKSLRDNVKKVKRRGTVPTEKRGAYKSLISAVLDKSVTQYHKFGTAISAYMKVRKPKKTASQNWWKYTKRSTRKDRLSDDVRGKIHNFYLSPQISRESPNKRDVLNSDGELIQQHTVYDRFKKENPDIKVGISVFKKEKPRNVNVVNETSHKTCLCQVCCNVALKLDHIKKFAEETENDKLKEKLKNVTKSKLSDMTMCDYTILPAPQCLERTCEKCGPGKIKTFLETDIDTKNPTKIKWYKWEGIQVMDDKNSKVKRVTSCVPKLTSVNDFLEELSGDLEKYPSHIFRANWQHSAMQNCIKQLKDGQVVMLEDFSENYRCRFQNESQSAYFDQQQVTVHPFMCYYPDHLDEKEIVVKHSVIVISNDRKHDAFAVKHFEKEAIDTLKDETEIREIIRFSDGCAAQYKGKNSFAHISKSDIPVSANYFETSHGKSPCDGLGAVFKNACFNAVKSEKAVIGNAKAAYDFCKSNLEHNKVVRKGDQIYMSKRNILYVDRNDVPREELGVKPLIGTRSVHGVQSMNSPFSVQARNLSCFCTECAQHSGACKNKAYVQPWTVHNLCPTGMKKSNHPPESNGHHVTETVQQNCIFKVSIDDAEPVAVQVCTTQNPSPAGLKNPNQPPSSNERHVKETDPQKSTNTVNQVAVADTNILPDSACSVEQRDTHSAEPVVGGYVLVRLTKSRRGRDTEKEFVARVVEIDGTECKLTYMTEKVVKRKKYFYWPND